MVRRPALVTVSDEEALAIPESQLPTYTVMVAAYHEANVIGQCIRALEQLAKHLRADRTHPVRLVLDGKKPGTGAPQKVGALCSRHAGPDALREQHEKARLDPLGIADCRGRGGGMDRRADAAQWFTCPGRAAARRR